MRNRLTSLKEAENFPVVIAKSQVTVIDVALIFNEAQVETCIVDLPEPQLVHEDGGILTSSVVLN